MKMLVFAAVILTAGCGIVRDIKSTVVGYAKLCVDGVSYIHADQSMVLQVDRQGRPVSCGS